MNPREEAVRRKYEAEGWVVLHTGAPDFFLFRGKQMRCIEVKSPSDQLSQEQGEFILKLKEVGIQTEVLVLNSPEDEPELAILIARKRRV